MWRQNCSFFSSFGRFISDILKMATAKLVNKSFKSYFGLPKYEDIGREPWYSGYGRRLTFQRSWARIPAPDTGWTLKFFTLICCKHCIVCLKKTENKRKRGRDGPIFLKKCMKTSVWMAGQPIILMHYFNGSFHQSHSSSIPT